MRIKETLTGLLYPKRCPVCHDVVEDKGELGLQDLQNEASPCTAACLQEVRQTASGRRAGILSGLYQKAS